MVSIECSKPPLTLHIILDKEINQILATVHHTMIFGLPPSTAIHNHWISSLPLYVNMSSKISNHHPCLKRTTRHKSLQHDLKGHMNSKMPHSHIFEFDLFCLLNFLHSFERLSNIDVNRIGIYI